MSAHYWQYKGQQRARAAIIASDPAALRLAIDIGRNCFHDTVPAGNFLFGVMDSLCAFLSSAEDAGLVFTDSNAERVDIDRLWMNLTGSINGASDSLDGLINVALAAYGVLLKTPGISVGLKQPTSETNEATPPQRIEIVSMPPRQTTTSIEYDRAGDIVRTTQNEVDR